MNEAINVMFEGLVRVLDHCLSRETSPLDKVIINLCTFLCCNPEETPQVDMFHFEDKVDPHTGIMSLYLADRQADKAQKLKNMKGISRRVARDVKLFSESIITYHVIHFCK